MILPLAQGRSSILGPLTGSNFSRIRDFLAFRLDNLTIADPTVNRSEKSDRDAAEWIPDRHGAWFAARVIAVKQEYELSVDPAERDALEMLLAGSEAELNCVGAAAVPGLPIVPEPPASTHCWP